jgi:hypothetical protein
MYHFATALCAGIVSTLVVGGTALTPMRVHQRPEWGCEGMTSGRATGC